MRRFLLGFSLLGFIPWAAAQHPQLARSAAAQPPQTYNIIFTIEQHVPPGTLLNGRPVRGAILNSRSYQLSLSGLLANAQIKVGNRIPIVVGGISSSHTSINTQFQYESIGVSIYCRLKPKNRIRYLANITSLAATNLTQPVPGFNEPTIRTIHTDGDVQIHLNRRLLVSTVADLSSKSVYYFYMTITKD